MGNYAKKQSLKSGIMGVVCLIISNISFAQDPLYSSVSPEFPDGLHSKYLKYLASKLDSDLVITPLPFGRRLVELGNGNLDIVVGVQANSIQDSRFITLEPSYESIQNTIFVKLEDKQKFNSIESFQKATFAVTIKGSYFPSVEQSKRPRLIGVSTLSQKIGLLEKGRVDGFVHFAPIAIKILDFDETDQVIVPAEYQPEQRQAYYFALSKTSKFVGRQDEIENIIQNGKINGDFQTIRNLHYSE